MTRTAAPRRTGGTPTPARASRATSRVAWFDPRGPYVVPLVLLIAGRAALLLLTPAPAEDAFITFRYAKNLAAGNGLVYNPGEHVMGFTSPLWTVWNALGVMLVRAVTAWAEVTSIAADVVTLLAGTTLALELGLATAWAFAGFFAVWPTFAALAVSGMEMNVFLALLTTGALLASRRSVASGPVLAALALTRPEGVAAAAVLAIGATWRDRVVALALAGAGYAALALRFGSPVPNSVMVKASVYGTQGPWAGRHWWEWLSPVVFGRWPLNGDTTLLMFLAVVFAPAAVLGGRELWRRRDTAYARAAAAATIVWLGYAALGVAYFWWYFATPLFACVLLVAAGLPFVVRGRAIPIALGLFVLSVWSIAFSLYRGRSLQELNSFGAMAGLLAKHAAPGDAVMLEPIGMIGYAAPLTVKVIDETGLVSPDVAQRRLQGPGWYTDVVAARRPRWLVVRRGVLESEAAFAGTGRPFRDSAERDALLARYPVVERAGDPNSTNELLLLERSP